MFGVLIDKLYVMFGVLIDKLGFFIDKLMIPTQERVEDNIKSIHSRVLSAGIVIGIAFAVLFIRIIWISIPQQSFASNHNDTEKDKVIRADIFDRNGELVARMSDTKSIAVRPREFENMGYSPDVLTKQLIKIFPKISYEYIYSKVTEKSSGVFLKDSISQSQHDAIIALGNAYGQNAVVVKTKQQLYADANLITDTDRVHREIIRIFSDKKADVKFSDEEADELYRKLTSGAAWEKPYIRRKVSVWYRKLTGEENKVLIAKKTTPEQRQQINLIMEEYNAPLFSYKDKLDVYVKPRQVKNPEQLATALHHIFPELSEENISKRLVQKSNFAWIKRQTTRKQQDAIKRQYIPTLIVKDSFVRIYPQNRLFSHILGFVNVDNEGRSGIEESANKQLGTDKTPIILTMDARVQHIVKSELQDIIDATNADGGVGIVMDVHNGEVISMVSLPDFNPHIRECEDDKITTRQCDLFNRATMGVYELGSTFKIINSAIALESGKIQISDTFDAREPIWIGPGPDDYITDYHPQNRVLDMTEVFIYSSNIGSARMAEKVGADFQEHMMRKLNLLDKLNIILPENATPKYPLSWNRIETMVASYGYGISITTLHLTSAVASLINGGKYYVPRFIKTDAVQPAYRRVVSKQTSDYIRKLMRLNTLEGSGKRSAVNGYVLGGKTGTANKVKNGKYDKKSRISSYIAGFPMHDPKYVVLVMVDEPKAGKFTQGRPPTGGRVAAPTVGKIVSRIAPLLGVRPVDENSEKIKALKIIPSYEKRKAQRKKQS